MKGLLLFGLLLAACGSEDSGSSSSDAVTVSTWTDLEKDTVRLNCETSSVNAGNTARGSVIYCNCIMGVITTKYTYDEFEKNEIKITKDLTEDGTLDNCAAEARDSNVNLTEGDNYEDLYLDIHNLWND